MTHTFLSYYKDPQARELKAQITMFIFVRQEKVISCHVTYLSNLCGLVSLVSKTFFFL